MPSNPIDNESPTPTFAARNLSFPHITALPRTAFFILRPPIQPNIKPHSRTFSIAPPRPPQTPAASFKSRYRKSSSFNIRRRLYMARLGLPINASDFRGVGIFGRLAIKRLSVEVQSTFRVSSLSTLVGAVSRVWNSTFRPSFSAKWSSKSSLAEIVFMTLPTPTLFPCVER